MVIARAIRVFFLLVISGFYFTGQRQTFARVWLTSKVFLFVVVWVTILFTMGVMRLGLLASHGQGGHHTEG